MRNVLLIAFLCIAIAVPALADIHKDTILTGTIGTLNLSADASWTGTVWHYTYTLTYTSSTVGGIIKTFQVENPGQLAFTNAANSGTFLNPIYDPQAYSIDWLSGYFTPGQTITFSYDSEYQPEVIPVYALTVDSGQSAGGMTIGMSNAVIPEPGSILTLAGMLAGVSAIWRRRR
ncbi:MAG TPA: PEP-CTERM sorting domain-containing protein [Armatimonadota bacterium]|nr:PEP-CTERM sorting domain-containing protein [Armatimonadota bacterium]